MVKLSLDKEHIGIIAAGACDIIIDLNVNDLALVVKGKNGGVVKLFGKLISLVYESDICAVLKVLSANILIVDIAYGIAVRDHNIFLL